MEIPEIRKKILSYLRKDARIRCSKCNYVIIWDKKINRKYLILLILLLAIQSIRGVGYFNAAGAFLLLSLFYLNKDKNIK